MNQHELNNDPISKGCKMKIILLSIIIFLLVACSDSTTNPINASNDGGTTQTTQESYKTLSFAPESYGCTKDLYELRAWICPYNFDKFPTFMTCTITRGSVYLNEPATTVETTLIKIVQDKALLVFNIFDNSTVNCIYTD